MYLNKLFIIYCGSIFLLLSCNDGHKINDDLEDTNQPPPLSLAYDFCQDSISIPHPFKDQLDYYWQYKEYELFTDAICYRKQNWPKEETAVKTGNRWMTKYKIKEDSALFIRHLAGNFSYIDLFGKHHVQWIKDFKSPPLLPKGVDGRLRLVVHWAILKEEKLEEPFNQGYYIYDFQVKTSLSDSFLQFDYLNTTALGHPPKFNPYFSMEGSPVIIRALGNPIVSTSLSYGDFRVKNKFESLVVAFAVNDIILYKPSIYLKQHISFYEANHSKGIPVTELNSLAKNAVNQFLESLKHKFLGKTPVLALIEKGLIQIKIKSYASETENLERNKALAEARATAVQSLLAQALGFPNVQFEIEIVEKLQTSDRVDYWHIDNVIELSLQYSE